MSRWGMSLHLTMDMIALRKTLYSIFMIKRKTHILLIIYIHSCRTFKSFHLNYPYPYPLSFIFVYCLHHIHSLRLLRVSQQRHDLWLAEFETNVFQQTSDCGSRDVLSTRADKFVAYVIDLCVCVFTEEYIERIACRLNRVFLVDLGF